MSEEESLEEKIANTEVKVGKWNITPAKAIGVFALVSTVLGTLYGAFEVYKDYMDMKAQIQSYVAPDLSGFQEQLSVLDQKMNGVEDSVTEARDYTRDIKTDLKADIDRLEQAVDSADQRAKKSEDTVREMIDLAEQRFDNKKESLATETDRKIKDAEDRLNSKIQTALDNPLAN
jgi:hypothetical protein